MRRASFLLLFTLSSALVFGCGHDHDQNHDNHDNHADMTPAEEACFHVIQGPFANAAASLEPEEAEANVNRAHHSYRITLQENEAGTFQGAVLYDASSSGSYGLFTTAEIPLAVFGPDGLEVETETSSVEECIEVEELHSVEIEAGEHLFFFGPTADSEVNLVIERLSSN